MARGWQDAVLTAGGGCLGVAVQVVGVVGWLGWVVGDGAPPLAGIPCPS